MRVSGKDVAIAAASELQGPAASMPAGHEGGVTKAARNDGHGRQASAKRCTSIAFLPSSPHATLQVPPRRRAIISPRRVRVAFDGRRAGACRCVASQMGSRRHSDRGRRKGATRAPLRDLSPHRGGQSRRRTCFDRCTRSDRRGVSRPCVLGHRDLHAAVLRLHRSSGSTGAAHVPLPHPRCGAAQGQGAGL